MKQRNRWLHRIGEHRTSDEASSIARERSVSFRHEWKMTPPGSSISPLNLAFAILAEHLD